MTGDEMRAGLAELGTRLESEGVHAKLWLVGGAVMVLAFQWRESSDDIDAAIAPSEDVLRIAREVGLGRGLEPEWLNNAAMAYIPQAVEPDWQFLGKYGALEVLRADEMTMLAMKLRASRGRRDMGDIEYLINRCGFTEEIDILEMYEQYFPEDPLSTRARPLIRAALAKMSGGDPTSFRSTFDSEEPVTEVGNGPTLLPDPSFGSVQGTDSSLWVRPTRGRFAHLLSRQDGDDILVRCGHRFAATVVTLSPTPGLPPCVRCGGGHH
jgi:hypothetical protein